MVTILKMSKYITQFQFDFRYEKKNYFFIMMTSQDDLKFVPLYYFINEMRKCFLITKKTEQIYHNYAYCNYVSWECDNGYVNSKFKVQVPVKRFSRPQNGSHFENVKILNTA